MKFLRPRQGQVLPAPLAGHLNNFMRFFLGIAFPVSLLINSGSASAQSPTVPAFLLACAACHGFDGIGQERRIPNLAGQHQEYLFDQLMAFRSGRRMHPEMSFFAGQIDQDELQQIVEYYAALPPPE